MHTIVIDDTYGPKAETGSMYVTGDRRTHVGVVFLDDDVPKIRKEILQYLKTFKNQIDINEFHFADIYNRRSPWNLLAEGENLKIFKFFSSLYKKYRWKIIIQTVDNRTLKDIGSKSTDKFDVDGFDKSNVEDFDLSKKEDLSLLGLLVQIKCNYISSLAPITLFLDEGREEPGTPFSSKLFRNWPKESFKGEYSSSAAEPLLQIADFFAFCINRSTHLSMKNERTDIDDRFLEFVSNMKIDCDKLQNIKLQKNFTVNDFDSAHKIDRDKKGIVNP